MTLMHAYCLVAVESVGRKIPIAFLERVKDDFNKKYGGGRAATAVANSLNKEFGSKMKEHIQYCVDHPEEISKLAKVLALLSIDDIAALQVYLLVFLFKGSMILMHHITLLWNARIKFLSSTSALLIACQVLILLFLWLLICIG
ncbi:vesicle-associated membrane protein 722-like [Magnolia sinica]|uniref:vesicle-associated membrane protein 722-like n=1 Tax=Magnolia sinica TaxID=86752 RepID=UPI00265A7A63|nr:vesicle-associated membrane protein 722-like [Magnolia sinica]